MLRARSVVRNNFLLLMLLALLACSSPSPTYTTHPVESTPYDLKIETLNRRLCEERRGRWERTTRQEGNFLVVTGGRCLDIP